MAQVGLLFRSHPLQLGLGTTGWGFANLSAWWPKLRVYISLVLSRRSKEEFERDPGQDFGDKMRVASIALPRTRTPL